MDEAIQKARRYCLLLLNRRAYSVAEVRAKLAAHAFGPAVIKAVVEEFVAKRLLDDAAFAKIYASWRMEARPMGLRVLRQELRKKGIATELIEAALAEEAGGDQEEARCVGLAQRRLGRLSGLGVVARRQRLMGFLSRRGFSYDVIERAVREVLGRQESRD